MKPNYKIRYRFSRQSLTNDYKDYIKESSYRDLLKKAYEDGYSFNGYYIFRTEYRWIDVDISICVFEMDMFIARITPDNFKYLFEEALDYFNSPEYYKYQRVEHDIRRT